MTEFRKKLLVILPVMMALATFCSRCIAQECDSALHKGISAVFLRKVELMTRENWRSEPLDVREAQKSVGRYDAFWCSQIMAQYNRPAWEFLRRNRPDQIMLYYVSATTVRKGDARIHFDYDYIETYHPEWFLLKDARNATPQDYKDEDKRIRWNPSDPKHSYYNRFYIDVTNRDFQQWAASQALNLVSGKKDGLAFSYNGLAMDNVYIGWRLHQRLRYKYPNWKYADDFKAWSEGFSEYLKTLKKALNQRGFILVINHNPVGSDRSKDQQLWNTIYESADGILTERAIRSDWRDSSYFTDDEWLAAISRHEEILDKGLINWWVCQPTTSGRDEHDAFLYTYCSWLLIKKPGKSFYGTLNEVVPWHDEYDLPLGKPLSARYLKDGCWIRDYNGAKIVVNPTRITRRVVIDDENQWLDWNSRKAVRELTISRRSGRILLPISQSSTKKD